MKVTPNNPDAREHQFVHEIINGNDARLRVVERTAPHYLGEIAFFAEAAVGDDWEERYFDSEKEAREWIKTVQHAHIKKQRTELSIPVTVHLDPQERNYSRPAVPERFEDCILRGLNPADGLWKITRANGAKQKISGGKIYKRMSAGDQKKILNLRESMRAHRKAERELLAPYEIKMPRTWGRVKTEEAIRKDAEAVALFEGSDDNA